jgi:hypothetical protein
MRRRLLVTVEFAHAVTNARFAALHGLAVAPPPSRRCPLRFANPRASHERASAMCRRSGGLPSAVRQQLFLLADRGQKLFKPNQPFGGNGSLP